MSATPPSTTPPPPPSPPATRGDDAAELRELIAAGFAGAPASPAVGWALGGLPRRPGSRPGPRPPVRGGCQLPHAGADVRPASRRRRAR